MLPIIEDLKGLSKEEVLAEIERCQKINREHGLEMSDEVLINMYLRDLGLQEPDHADTTIMKNAPLTNPETLKEDLEKLATEYLRGDNWKKLAKLESEQANKQEPEVQMDK